MKKNPDRTPRSKIKNALRILWMRSRERGAALRATGYCCSKCNGKASKAKGRAFDVHVHHKIGIGNWDRVIDVIYEELLCDKSLLVALCPSCHAKEHPELQPKPSESEKGNR